ncbi:MAG: hypothetical protein U0869_06570 [Chloroflexota bacterium]
MSLEWIIVGIFALLIGAAFCFSGFKWFLVLLPIWGAIVGFTWGMDAMHALFGSTFFADALALVVGIITAVVFAVLSYLYYYFAVVLIGGAIGYYLGVGVMDWLNLGGLQILTFIVGIVVGAIFAYGFIVLAMPAILAIWGTAILGAAAMVSGIILILNLGQFPGTNQEISSQLDSISAISLVGHTALPWLWIIVGIVLAVAGGMAQIRMVGRTAEAINKDQYRNPGMA